MSGYGSDGDGERALTSRIVPQANKLETVRQLVLLSHRDQLRDRERAKAILKLSDRHLGYYRDAAEALGLVAVDADGAVHPTSLGASLLATAPGSRNEAKVLLEGAEHGGHLGDVAAFLRGDEDIDPAALAARLQTLATLSESTARRRATCLMAWRTRLTKLLSHESSPAPSVGQLELFGGHEPAPLRWPDAERFPYNDPPGENAGRIVREDLARGTEALIVTGYSSLEYLVKFLGQNASRTGNVRLAFGVEPAPSERSDWAVSGATLSDEMRDYWLGRGFSIELGGGVLAVIDMVRSGRLSVRISQHHRRRIHAKVFVTPEAATLGSSNFSEGGMRNLVEANVRFRRSERRRYEETCQVAEACWETAADFSDGFVRLLEELLQHVTWEEALARAAAELLEGRWTESARARYADAFADLWPSQKQGIAQALWTLENVGSVLVADATGSGKTRFAAHLVRILRDRMLAGGRGGPAGLPPVDPVIVVPPATRERWRDELSDCGLYVEPHSHGVLSAKNATGSSRLGKALRRAQLLVVDEAHNFLSPGSLRTVTLLGNMAEHTILFTATPINRGTIDLLSIVNMLGADNLDEAGVHLVRRRTWQIQRGKHTLSEGEIDELRAEVQRFTVRRTKAMLGALIAREPDEYRNALGQPCRYPEPRTREYELAETVEDCAIAAEIREVAGQLRGLAGLRSAIEMPEWMRAEMTEEQYVSMRLRGAAGLAKHHIMAALRSSRAALLEHLRGTERACAHAGIEAAFKENSGDVIGVLRGVGEPPAQPLTRWLPSWLTDGASYREAVDAEIGRLEEIERLAGRLSDARDRARARLLREVVAGEKLVLAFDSRPISLAVLAKRLDGEDSRLRVVVATGHSKRERRQVNEMFALESAAERTIALCSDAMSEGLNLQKGSVLVQLDMPSVMRVAEQRIGRIDRMDSPHASIDIWWPKDAEEFALRSDDHFFARYELVKGLIGANIEVPNSPAAVVTPAALMQSEEERASDVLVVDAFAPVRALVDGPDAIVPATVYEKIRTSQATVIAAVSVVRAEQPWAFFAIRGSELASPRWVLFASEDGSADTVLSSIAERLRRLLPHGTETLAYDERADELLRAFVGNLAASEHQLLPPKKRRALEQMQKIVKGYLKTAEREGPADRRELLERLDAVADPVRSEVYVDPRELADRWLAVVRPRWHARLTAPGRQRRRPLLLNDLRQDLKQKPVSTEELRAAFAELKVGEPVGRRVAAAIVGVP